MDHFLLPKDAIPIRPGMDRVPYVCTEKYDGGPFLTYPLRKGRPWMVPELTEEHQLPYSVYENLHPTPVKELESLCQSWLFFGILNEVLGSAYREDDFITPDPSCVGKTILYSNNIQPLLERSCTAYFEDEPKKEQRQRTLEHLIACISSSGQIFSVITAKNDFDWRIKCSMAAVFEAIVFEVRRASKEPVPMPSWANLFFNEDILQQMLSAGWCPSEIARAKDKFVCLQSLAFLSRMNRSEIPRDHSDCTSRLCSAYQITATTYQPKHRQSHCKCIEAAPNIQDICNALQKGELPLLKISQTNGTLESLNIEVVTYTPETPYVAISHVWADGLGNPSKNSLPRCQLSHLLKHVDTLRTSTPFFFDPDTRARDVEERPLLIWLDTLCCPVSPSEAKGLAIAEMRRTYESSKHVLLLDAGLQLYSRHEISCVEALARVFSSGWMSRLWTLQEARLARTLWVQFKDGPVDIDELYMKLTQIESDVRFLPFTNDMISQYNSIRSKYPRAFFSPDWDAEKTVGILLSELEFALHHRSVSMAEDEAICISTLMDLPLSKIVAVAPTAQARMGRFWELVAEKYGGIPQQILAFEQPKLTQPGKRWALASLLTLEDRNTDLVRTRILHWNNPILGKPIDAGLLVTFPGFKLHLRQSNDGMTRNPWIAMEQLPEWHLLFTATTGEQYDIASLSDIDSHAGEEKEERAARKHFLHSIVHGGPCAIIILNADDISPGGAAKVNKTCQGLLVQLTTGTEEDKEGNLNENRENHILAAHIKTHVILSPLLPQEKLLYSNVEILARSLRTAPFTRTLSKLITTTPTGGANASNNNNNNNNPEYTAAVEDLKKQMQKEASAVLENVPGLTDALKSIFDVDEGKALGLFWRLVAEWYYHDFEGSWLGKEQRWCVD